MIDYLSITPLIAIEKKTKYISNKRKQVTFRTTDASGCGNCSECFADNSCNTACV